MKILVLTATYGDDLKIHLIIDKIVSYYEESGHTVVDMLDGYSYCVKEPAVFITQQLASAEVFLRGRKSEY